MKSSFKVLICDKCLSFKDAPDTSLFLVNQNICQKGPLENKKRNIYNINRLRDMVLLDIDRIPGTGKNVIQFCISRDVFHVIL